MSELALGISEVADIAVARHRHSRDNATLLRGVALFDGFSGGELAPLLCAFTRLDLEPGEILWRQASPSTGLAVLLAGEARVFRRLPGERDLELARLGPGDVMGEIALLSGGAHSATVQSLGHCSVLQLGRADFEARMLSDEPSALELKQRIIAIACQRLRRAHAELAATADESLPRREPIWFRPACQLMRAAAPPVAYLSRLPLFRGLDPSLITELLDRGTVLAAPRGQVAQHPSRLPEHCYVTLNGAVEEVVQGPDALLRVGLAGPGHAFGFVGLLDGKPGLVTSVTRERSLLLAIEPEHFVSLLSSGGTRVKPFATRIEADLITGLETAERTLSHLAARAS